MGGGYGVTPELMAVAVGRLSEAEARLAAIGRALEQAVVPDAGAAEVTMAVRQETARLAQDAGATARDVARAAGNVARNRAAYASAEKSTARSFGATAGGGARSVFG